MVFSVWAARLIKKGSVGVWGHTPWPRPWSGSPRLGRSRPSLETLGSRIRYLELPHYLEKPLLPMCSMALYVQDISPYKQNQCASRFLQRTMTETTNIHQEDSSDIFSHSLLHASVSVREAEAVFGSSTQTTQSHPTQASGNLLLLSFKHWIHPFALCWKAELILLKTYHLYVSIFFW